MAIKKDKILCWSTCQRFTITAHTGHKGALALEPEAKEHCDLCSCRFRMWAEDRLGAGSQSLREIDFPGSGTLVKEGKSSSGSADLCAWCQVACPSPEWPESPLPSWKAASLKGTYSNVYRGNREVTVSALLPGQAADSHCHPLCHFLHFSAPQFLS